ncbi:lysophospholipid acyltransferase family protein [Gilvimarinus polysaccharolyticus]|uniref:lysophospholipid acyltransferase family protein n=1 Tax=Gilvimarinus polysaccharolyticus TaxID=863921 RepID=UPI000A5D6C1D|nr:lysophospholipid acyltransferase family protein [Gilvimarinus polysaccharolyticus]
MKDAIILMLLKLLGNLPLAVAQVLGTGVGWLMWCAGSRAARVTKTNLALCYTGMSAAERRKLARQSLLESGRLAAEIPVVWRRSNAWLQKKIKTVHGSDLLSAALAKRRGVIVLTPHLGDWEVLPALLTLHSPLIALYQPPKDKALDEYIQHARRRPDTQLAATNRRGVAALTKALRAGQIAGILPDQVPDAGNGGIEVPFCGEPALTMTLVHKLIQRTECEVLLTYVLRVKGGFEVVISRCDDSIYSDDTYESVAAMNRTIARAVATAPAQYQWEYKRFKGREQVEPY